MRENRTYGSEGGEPGNGSLPYTYPCGLFHQEHSLGFATFGAAEAVEIYAAGHSSLVLIRSIPYHAVDPGFHILIDQGIDQLSLQVIDV